ncbi:MAG: FAD-dependent oxidoreductase [Pyrinomonadaceae bacterium]
MMKAVIIGAGPAGLTAGYELSKLGIGSTVLEADATVGGISRTVNYKNYRFDIGGHRFFTKVPVVNDLWQEMLGSDLLTRSRMSRIHYRGKYFDYPFKASNALLGLGPVESLLVGLSYTKARMFPSEQETNFEQWVSNRFGSRLYEIFFKTYTEKVWGIPCTEISADWAAQRIKNLSFQEAVRSALVGAKKTKGGDVITSLIESFQYPRLGPGMMWERCEELLGAQGNETLRGVKVDRIRHRHGRVECVYGQTAAGDREEFAADQFISTMPLRKLMQSLDPLPPDEVLLAAKGCATETI